VLELVRQDLDDTAISTTLAMSRKTVRNHVARIYAKIDVNKRGAALV
jgi:DNA-binding CsgD family transcriptional regulator